MMEEFDIEKDFSKQPYDELPTHKLFPLSECVFPDRYLTDYEKKMSFNFVILYITIDQR